MVHKNPVVLSTDGKKHETLGSGDTLAPGSIPVSAEAGNGLTTKADGLFAEPGSGGGGLSSVSHNNSLSGEGTAASPLAVRVSGRNGNAIQFLDLATSEGGMFASKMIRGTGGGNWSFGYPDSPGAKNACGKIGSGVYWKTTIEMSNANAGDVNVKLDVWIKNLPCMEDGTMVSHRVVVDYVSATTSAKPTAAIWLICDTAPTHMINIETKTITKLQRSPDSPTTGLPDYPTAPDGEYAKEFSYSRQYFYMA